MSFYDAQLFIEQTNELGEGILWNSARNSLLWLDINKKLLFEKLVETNVVHSGIKSWELTEIVSALILNKQNSDVIFMVSDCSISSLCLDTGEVTLIKIFELGEDYRANDAGVSPEGELWFGSMEKKPRTCNGSIYSFSKNGQLKTHLNYIGIPNTFCWNNDGNKLFLSDSLVNKLYQFSFGKGEIHEFPLKELISSKKLPGTPDGGVIDVTGNLWVALWGAALVVCISERGELLHSISLPALNPSNCCFGGRLRKTLYITTAREGLSPEDLIKYPLSGSIFKIELPFQGKIQNAFTYECSSQVV